MSLTRSEITKLGKRRASLIDRLDKALKRFIRELARDTYNLFLEVLTELDANEDGTLKNTAKNRNLQAIEKQKWKRNPRVQPNNLSDHIVNGFNEIKKENENYFNQVGNRKGDNKGKEEKPRENKGNKDNKEKQQKDREKSFEELLEKMGINKNGYTGIIEGKTDDSAIHNKARLIMLKGVFEGKSKVEVREDIKRFLIEKNTYEDHYRSVINDVYAEFDRALHYRNAMLMGLRSAIYEGGLIDTSREFCEVRNSKVFTIEEILNFGTKHDKFEGYTNKATGEFKGKNYNYNALLDAGGFNCRHFYSFISDELAMIIRPELKDIYGKDDN